MPPRRIMMSSPHGYLTAELELGLPDTGGQMVFVLELSKHLGRMGYAVDIYTRQFGKKKCIEKVDDNVRVISIPSVGNGPVRKKCPKKHPLQRSENARAFMIENRQPYAFRRTA